MTSVAPLPSHVRPCARCQATWAETNGALERVQGYGTLTLEHATSAAAAHDWLAECQALLRLKGSVLASAQVLFSLHILTPLINLL